MTHENKHNEAPGNKASEIKKNVVELNENDLSKVAGGTSYTFVDAEGNESTFDDGLKDRDDGVVQPAEDSTIQQAQDPSI